jgi:4-amino-4-deoxy-L-arabinose transferase-like glycosyltransferase
MNFLQRQITLKKWAILAAIVILSSTFVSFSFARVQSTWGDESTQLAGLSLTPSGLLDWLTGHDPFRFGVPPDRMPPLGYLLSRLWTTLFGVQEFAMRMLSLLMATGGLIFVAATLRRISQSFAGIIVLALYALSLNYVQYSIEIRPYALVLLLASGMIYAAKRSLDSDDLQARRWWIIAIAAGGIAGFYSHYTTLVFSLSLLGALGLLAIHERRGFWTIVLAAIAVVLASLPLVPLIVASMAVKTAVLQTEWRDVPRYFARLFSSRPEAVIAPVLGIAVLSKLVALGSALAARPQRFQTAMLITICVAIFGMLISALIVPGSMLQPHYSIWLLPPLFTLLLMPANAMRPRMALVNNTALVVNATCLLGSLVLFLTNMQAFSHGPSRQIAAAIASAPQNTTIVYDYGADAWWNTYYPVRLAEGRARHQILVLMQDGAPHYYDPDGYMPNLNGVPMAELPGNPLQNATSIILIRASSFDLSDMRRYIFGGTANLEANDVEAKIAALNGYKVVSEAFVPGTTSARVLVMGR